MPRRPGLRRLTNHLIRPVKHRLRNCQTDLLRRFQIDDKLELRWLLHWQVGGFCAFKDLVGALPWVILGAEAPHVAFQVG